MEMHRSAPIMSNMNPNLIVRGTTSYAKTKKEKIFQIIINNYSILQIYMLDVNAPENAENKIKRKSKNVNPKN